MISNALSSQFLSPYCYLIQSILIFPVKCAICFSLVRIVVMWNTNRYILATKASGKDLHLLYIQIDFLSYIFSVSENTKTIHLIMMIWLFSFIISSYKIVSSPPQDPGGSKKILSKSGYDS